MNKSLKKVLLLLAGVLLGIVLTIGFLFIRQGLSMKFTSDQRPVIELNYGSKIDSGMFSSIDDTESVVLPKGYVLVSINPSCSSCIEELEVTKILENILKNLDLSVVLLWETKPDQNFIEKGTSIQFLSNKRIANPGVKYLFISGDNTVSFITNEISNLVDYLYQHDVVDQRHLSIATNQYLINEYGSSDANKKKLLYFAMENCPDCMRADDLLNDNNVSDLYEIITIYTDDSAGSKPVVDRNELLKTIYAIEWYPSFVIINSDSYQIIGKQDRDEDILKQLQKSQ